MAEIPKTMRSLVAPRQCSPAEFEIQVLPVPTITLPTQVLIRVHAAGIATGDVALPSGKLGMFFKAE